MRIAVVGAGALGQIYGVRLAADHDVSFVVRPARLAETRAFRLELARPGGRVWDLPRPVRVDRVPEGTDVALVTLRLDAITRPDEDLRRALTVPAGTLVVVLTPVFPEQLAALAALASRPVVPAMPNTNSYEDERGVVRHWVPAIATTLVDDGTENPPDARPTEADRALRARLVGALEHAGIPARLERGVAAIDAATTTAFFPMIAAVAIAGSTEAVMADDALVELVLASARECQTLASRLGRPAPWSSLLTKFLGRFTLRAGVAMARRSYPESVHFVDLHFGPKLRAQHLDMGRHLVARAAELGVSVPRLRALVERL